MLVVQGGLLPTALEVWRRSGTNAIVGISLLSPPPLRFFTEEDEEEMATDGEAGFSPPSARVRKRDRLLFWRRRSQVPGSLPPEERAAVSRPRRRASRRIQWLVWAVACSPVGNIFFRRLRGGSPKGARIREFTQDNLFARCEWGAGVAW